MDDDIVGTQLDDFIVGNHLGTGGMGSVYQAFSNSLKEPLAIKVLMPQSADEDDELRKRFAQEVDVLQRLKHSHIIPIYGYGADKGYLYFVMYRIRGVSLEEMLHKRHFSPLAAWWVLHPVALALDHAHNQGIIHRDIKPGNIMIEYKSDHAINSDAHVYLGDFGLSKVIGATTMTGTGMSLGTPHYMSPEQVKGERLTPASDIYSLGVVIYELLLGRLPFYARRLHEIAFKRLEVDPPAPSSLHPAFPKNLEAVLLRSLNRDPQDRFASARDFSAAYAQAVKDMEPDARQADYAVKPPQL